MLWGETEAATPKLIASKELDPTWFHLSRPLTQLPSDWVQWEGATRKLLFLAAYSPGVPLRYIEIVQWLMSMISTKWSLGTCSSTAFLPLICANSLKKCTYALHLMSCNLQGTDFGWTLIQCISVVNYQTLPFPCCHLVGLLVTDVHKIPPGPAATGNSQPTFCYFYLKNPLSRWSP